MDEEYPFVVCFVQLLSDCFWGLSWPGMFCHRDFVDWRNIHRTGMLRAHANSVDGAGEAPEGAAGCESWAADNPAKLLNSSQNHIQNWLESGVHQAARSAIFQAAVGLLKPKLVQPPSRHKPTLGSAMSCGRKFSASVVNAAIVNRNSKGLYTCKRTRKFTLQCKLIAKTIACCSVVGIWCSANRVHIC